MICNKAVSSNKGGVAKVTYHYGDGRTVVHEGGSRSWRNNNPGNLRGAVNRRVGVDADGFDIYPDLQSGEAARRRMFELGGKYYGYDSVRQVLGGLKDKNGGFIKGTAYAPSNDRNTPDTYANNIKVLAGIDVDDKKIADLTSEEKDNLENAMKKLERWRTGAIFEYDRKGSLMHNYIPGTNNSPQLETDDYEDWGFTLSP
jgi:hypothetical protein